MSKLRHKNPIILFPSSPLPSASNHRLLCHFIESHMHTFFQVILHLESSRLIIFVFRTFLSSYAGHRPSKKKLDLLVQREYTPMTEFLLRQKRKYLRYTCTYVILHVHLRISVLRDFLQATDRHKPVSLFLLLAYEFSFA